MLDFLSVLGTGPVNSRYQSNNMLFYKEQPTANMKCPSNTSCLNRTTLIPAYYVAVKRNKERAPQVKETQVNWLNNTQSHMYKTPIAQKT